MSGCRAERLGKTEYDIFAGKRVHSEGPDHEHPHTEGGSAGPVIQESAQFRSGGRGSNSSGGTVARRTNYGFEKKQRELRKQQKKKEKAERRSQEEETSSAPTTDEAADETPPESGRNDHG
jgi:hypothetical protein